MVILQLSGKRSLNIELDEPKEIETIK